MMSRSAGVSGRPAPALAASRISADFTTKSASRGSSSSGSTHCELISRSARRWHWVIPFLRIVSGCWLALYFSDWLEKDDIVV